MKRKIPKLSQPEHPIREVLEAMTGQKPPAFVKGYDFKGLTDAQLQELQDWCCIHVKPSWLTGIGLMDAAESQVEEAVSNANIPPEPPVGSV